MKVFLSGRVSGLKPYQEAFANAEIELLEMGYEVLNPAAGIDDMTEPEIMRRAINMLLDAEVVVMLPHWEQSDAALIERHLARKLGLPIWNQGTLPPLEI